MSTTRVPAVDWFTVDTDGPHLLGTRCASCATVYFPPEHRFCRNPHCDGDGTLDTTRLSRRGRVWSHTTSRYPPPAPYVPRTDPFEPFTLAAVELAAERIVVLGQVVPGVAPDSLRVGDEVELAEGTLHADGERAYTIWNWRPVPPGDAEPEGDRAAPEEGPR